MSRSGSFGLSLVDQLRSQAAAVEALFAELARVSHTEDAPIVTPNGQRAPGRWLALDDSGLRLLYKTETAYGRFLNLAEVLIRRALPSRVGSLLGPRSTVNAFLDRGTGAVWNNADGLHSHATKALAEQRDLVCGIPCEKSDELLVVADTSALLDVPNLGAWDFCSAMTMILPPIAVRELDGIKDDKRRDESVRQAARQVLTAIHGAGDRGSLLDGVAVTSALTIQLDPADRRVQEVLPWLVQDEPDDQLVAAAVDIAARHPGRPMLLVTHDLTVTTKAQAAGITVGRHPAFVRSS